MTNAWLRCASALLGLLCLFAAGLARAHKSSDAYVHLAGGDASATTLRVDVALRDLDVALDLDTDGNAQLTWGEVRAAWPAMERYVLAHVQLEGCVLNAGTRSLERRIDGVYAALQWQPDCRPAGAPRIRYSMLADIDPTHRGIARIEWAGSALAIRVLGPQAEAPTPGAATAPSAAASSPAVAEPAFMSLVREGMRHILTGYDHMLFLVCLLLPCVMRRTAHGWQPVERWAQALWPVAGIVTAFTIAHSITLALAATQTFVLAPSIIEPAIAATIILTALDNVRPIFGGRRVAVAFGFGLIHGFGFAGVLNELQLPPTEFAWSLLQFNLGLELGQLLIVASVTALLFGLRRRTHYAQWFIRGGSVAVMAIGAIWLVERTANVSLMPF